MYKNSPKGSSTTFKTHISLYFKRRYLIIYKSYDLRHLGMMYDAPYKLHMKFPYITSLMQMIIFFSSRLNVEYCFVLVNGGWGSWSEWSGWAKGLCAGNQRVKTRPCTNPSPSSDGDYCVGDNAVNQPGPGTYISHIIF